MPRLFPLILTGLLLISCKSENKPYYVDRYATPINRSPYIQSLSHNSAKILWQNKGESESLLTVWSENDPSTRHFYFDSRKNDFNISLSDLIPNSKYFYKSTGEREFKGFFHTRKAPEQDESCKILVLGDSGSDGLRSVYKSISTKFNNFDSILLLGDNAYTVGSEDQYNRLFFSPLRKILSSTPVYSVLGNHDAASMLTYTRLFAFPKHGECGGVPSKSEIYYSYNNGPVHIVVLDAFATNMSKQGKMIKWLRKDLLENDKAWTIACWHHTPYGKGGHNSDAEEELVKSRKIFNPILEEYGVDLVLNGHIHSYARTEMIHGHFGESKSYDRDKHMKQTGPHYLKYNQKDKNGTVYVLLGCSGKIDGKSKHPAHIRQKNQLGGIVVDADLNSLDIKFINNQKSIADHFTISKANSLMFSN